MSLKAEIASNEESRSHKTRWKEKHVRIFRKLHISAIWCLEALMWKPIFNVSLYLDDLAHIEHKIGNVWEATMCNLLQSIYRFLSCVVPNENSLRMSSISLRKFPSRCWTHFIDSWIIQFVRWKAQIYVASWVNRNEYKPSLPVIPFVCRCH